MYLQGMVDEDELDFIKQYLEEIPEHGSIVDIGTHDGKTAFYMGLHTKPAVKVYTVDIEIKPNFFKHIDYLELNHKVFFIRSMSKHLASLWTIPLDLVFVDGSHNTDDVIADIEGFIPHLKRGGLMVFHDYGNLAFGVTEAVDKFKGKLYEFVDEYKLIKIVRKL